jgi:hypothetical protein
LLEVTISEDRLWKKFGVRKTSLYFLIRLEQKVSEIRQRIYFFNFVLRNKKWLILNVNLK